MDLVNAWNELSYFDGVLLTFGWAFASAKENR